MTKGEQGRRQLETAAKAAATWLERHHHCLVDTNLITDGDRREWQSRARALRRGLRDIDETLGTVYRPPRPRH